MPFLNECLQSLSIARVCRNGRNETLVFGEKGVGKIVVMVLLNMTMDFRRSESADVGPRLVGKRFGPGMDHRRRNKITKKEEKSQKALRVSHIEQGLKCA